MKRPNGAPGAHLRLISTLTPPAEPTDSVHKTIQELVDASLTAPPPGIGPYEQALAVLTLAVATDQPDLFDPQLRVLQYCGFNRDQLEELMSLMVQIAGPAALPHVAEVMERYDVMAEDLPNL